MQNTQQRQPHATARYSLVPRTLSFIFSESHILLIKGTSSKAIYPNLYNGVGGHVERGETISEAALREIREETTLTTIANLRLRGTITINTSSNQTGIILFVFTGTSTTITIRSSPEGEPQWVPIQAVFSLPCVPDIPAILAQIAQMQDTEPPFHIHYPTRKSLTPHAT
jgi:8-oxo-dGTP diphosphatase